MDRNLERIDNLKLLKSYQIINSWLSKKSKKKILKLTFLSICVGLLEVTSLGSIAPILNLFNSKNQISGPIFFQNYPNSVLLLLAILFGLFLCLIAFFKIKTISYGSFLSAKIGNEIGKKLLINFLGQKFTDHNSKESTSVINVFTIHLNGTVKFVVFSLQLITALLSTICIFTFLVIQNPISIIGTFTSISLIYFFLSRFYREKNLEAANNVKIGADKVASLIQEISSNREKYILEYNDKLTLDEFSGYDRLARVSSAKFRNYTLLPRYVIEATAVSIFVILTMLTAILFEVDNVTLIAKLSISVFGIQKLLPSLNLIYQSLNMIFYFMKSVYTVHDLFSDNADLTRHQFCNKNKSHFKESINLENISFGYKKNNFLINSFNLKIKKGDKILIRGKSGLGKTTLVNIICSLIKPNDGKILIDNQLLGDQITLPKWRQQIAIVKQKPFLRSGKVVDLIIGNNLYKDINTSIRKAEYYAKLACINEVIDKFPEGYLQYIEEDGKNLSGGQIQRIAIANAISLEPSLLILDESTSGLNKKIEEKILNNIFGIKDITVICISHSKNLENIFKNHINI